MSLRCRVPILLLLVGCAGRDGSEITPTTESNESEAKFATAALAPEVRRISFRISCDVPPGSGWEPRVSRLLTKGFEGVAVGDRGRASAGFLY